MFLIQQLKMDMGGDDLGEDAMPMCKISMLWNWNTIDSCFIAETWHVRSRGMFAGSCIGVFFLVFASQWLSRVSKEFELAADNGASAPFNKQTIKSPLVYLISHRWLANPARTSITNHIIKSILYTIQWGVSYIIMLLFMYYNGYIIISCILGALFGHLVFAYNAPAVADEEVTCCKT